MDAIIEKLIKVVFWGALIFGANKFLFMVGMEASKTVAHGLSPLSGFTQKMTGERFDWTK